jgi:hypothetical protein
MQVRASTLHPVDPHHPDHDITDGNAEQHQQQWGGGRHGGGFSNGADGAGSYMDRWNTTGELVGKVRLRVLNSGVASSMYIVSMST